MTWSHLHFDVHCDKNWLFQATELQMFRQRCTDYVYIYTHTTHTYIIYLCLIGIAHFLSTSPYLCQCHVAMNMCVYSAAAAATTAVTVVSNQNKCESTVFIRKCHFNEYMENCEMKSMLMILLTKCAFINFVKSFDFPVNSHFSSLSLALFLAFFFILPRLARCESHKGDSTHECCLKKPDGTMTCGPLSRKIWLLIVPFIPFNTLIHVCMYCICLFILTIEWMSKWVSARMCAVVLLLLLLYRRIL